MHLSGPLAGLTLLLTTVVASPVEQSPNPALEKRYTLGGSLGNLFYGNTGQCTNPSQINLKGDPGILTTQDGVSSLQSSCGWKMWAACAAVAGGFCISACTAAAATE